MSRVSIVAAATPTKIPIIVGQNVCDTTKAPDIPPCRAKGDANPDFLRPLHDRIRRDAVDTDRRHHQRGQGKKAEQKRAVALGAQGMATRWFIVTISLIAMWGLIAQIVCRTSGASRSGSPSAVRRTKVSVPHEM
jgi:hypothetical protein